MKPKNDYFGASASYEHAITAKIVGILVNLNINLDSKGFCATSKNGFFTAIFCDLFRALSLKGSPTC